jgi:DNA-binding response OmpR family regulator
MLVEPDALVREMLTASLELHEPAWRVEAFETADSAAVRLAGHGSPDLVLLELAAPDPRRGTALLQQIRGRATRLPVLLLTAAPEEAWRRALDVDAVLMKPPDMDVLLPRVERLLALHRGSVVRGIALGTLLQMLEVERKDCTLTVSGGGESGRLWIRGGRLQRAEAQGRRGRAAFFAMLDWPAPVVDVLERCDVEEGDATRLQELLLAHAIEKDHGGRR